MPLTPGAARRAAARRQAAAPAGAPAAVKAIIAAGNQIVGKPYVYGGGHGLPLDAVAPALRLLVAASSTCSTARGCCRSTYDAPSGDARVASARPGPGRWVTIYASADHVFMYVAGLRWDTHNAAGPTTAAPGSAGIRWCARTAGFVVRHPVGL